MMGNNLQSVELFGTEFDKWVLASGNKVKSSILGSLDQHIRFLVNDLSTDGYNIWEKVWP